jgi:hypothetical protein
VAASGGKSVPIDRTTRAQVQQASQSSQSALVSGRQKFEAGAGSKAPLTKPHTSGIQVPSTPTLGAGGLTKNPTFDPSKGTSKGTFDKGTIDGKSGSGFGKGPFNPKTPPTDKGTTTRPPGIGNPPGDKGTVRPPVRPPMKSPPPAEKKKRGI